ncbi:hypothetical protein OXB_3346 [Bacillus sp. OxB-1]|uniref:hypothetical protein n=1 Tax=Bacillus sp. (strain OxB-1) TaxID=98228 RepID=UPI000581DFE0|nr:hypothetical protein [Bacillus sp. OxB-1]BAQ11815.1 hypothetical protein OXB_3346 [Bacillus sp. OxB-1]
MKKFTAYEMAEISVLACLIIIAGSFKIPTGIPGSEFQLSAPLAVAIAAVFGFKRYLIAGILSSLILFLLGIHTIINIEISMIFRLTVGLILVFFGTSLPVLLIAGPIGTTMARLGLALTLGVPFWTLYIPTIPGMLITAACAWPLTKLLRSTYQKVGSRQYEKRAI